MVVRRIALVLFAAAIVGAAGCGGSAGVPASGIHHEPSQGWSAKLPAGWTAIAAGPEFVRNDPLTDPSRLYVETYPHRSPTPPCASSPPARVSSSRGRTAIAAAN